VEAGALRAPGASRAAGWRRGSVLAAALLAAPPGSAPAADPARESWRKVDAGSVTVVGTASDPKLVETAVALRALEALLPELVPGAFGAPPPLVVAVAHEPAHLARVGLPAAGAADGRIVLATTGEEEARPGLLRAAAAALALRARVPLPGWVAAGLAEYLSTLSVAGGRATVGRPVPAHVALLRASRPDPSLFSAPSLSGDDARSASRRAAAWAVVHVLLHGAPDGAERLGRHAALLAEGRDAAAAFRDAFGASERALLERATAHAVAGRSLARFVVLPAGTGGGRVLPLTRAGAAGVLGGVVRGRSGPLPVTPEGAAAAPGLPRPGAATARPAGVSRDVPAEVDLVNRLIDEGREEEALARLEALHASLGRDPEMQRALDWDVREVRRVVVHNRLVRRYNEAIGLLNAGRGGEALPIFRDVAAKAEDPGLRRLAWERANAPASPRR